MCVPFGSMEESAMNGESSIYFPIVWSRQVNCCLIIFISRWFTKGIWYHDISDFFTIMDLACDLNLKRTASYLMCSRSLWTYIENSWNELRTKCNYYENAMYRENGRTRRKRVWCSINDILFDIHRFI